MNQKQLDFMKSAPGFIAALDQSGGSTPKALKAYGILESAYHNDDEMFRLVHKMRTRIMTAPSFNHEKILAAILFENTMNRKVADKYTADYLWEEKEIIPILKIDKGLAEVNNDVRLMKPINNLEATLDLAIERHIFGTKMRSVILQANEKGINEIVKQQFQLAKIIIAKGLVPIIEPEVDINAPDKAKCEELLKAALAKELANLKAEEYVMLKLTLPNEANLYHDLYQYPALIRIVALSGGYTRNKAVALLAANHDVIASFSRALSEGLSAQQTEAEFDAMLKNSIDQIYQASIL